MPENLTPNLGLRLPHPRNDMIEDVVRIADALTALDEAVAAKPDTGDLARVAATGSYNDLSDKPDLQDAYTLPMATPTSLGGVKVGSGLGMTQDGTLYATGGGGGGGEGAPSFNEVVLTPDDGQTTLTAPSGYTPGTVELFKNGVLLYPNGDDYFASDGATLVLNSPATSADTFLLRIWTSTVQTLAVYGLQILSSAGDKFYKGDGSTTATPVLHHGSEIVSDLSGWKFTWYLNNGKGKRAAFVDLSKISIAGGADITASTAGTSATFTYSGAAYPFAAGDIIKCVQSNGEAFFYEVASSSGNTVTIRTHSTNGDWLTFADYPAPTTASAFAGGKLFGCTADGTRTTTGPASITVNGDEIDKKGTITCEARRLA